MPDSSELFVAAVRNIAVRVLSGADVEHIQGVA
jgi:hypothetical protein